MAHSAKSRISDLERKIILEMAECNLNRVAVSKKIYMHRNTIDYHLRQIWIKTGLDPRTFYGLLELLRTEAIDICPIKI